MGIKSSYFFLIRFSVISFWQRQRTLLLHIKQANISIIIMKNDNREPRCFFFACLSKKIVCQSVSDMPFSVDIHNKSSAHNNNNKQQFSAQWNRELFSHTHEWLFNFFFSFSRIALFFISIFFFSCFAHSNATLPEGWFYFIVTSDLYKQSECFTRIGVVFRCCFIHFFCCCLRNCAHVSTEVEIEKGKFSLARFLLWNWIFSFIKFFFPLGKKIKWIFNQSAWRKLCGVGK